MPDRSLLLHITIAIPRSPRPRQSCGPGHSRWTASRWSLATMALPCSMRSTGGAKPRTRCCARSTLNGKDLWPLALNERKAKLARAPIGIVFNMSTPTRTAPWCSGTPASWGSRASCRSGSAPVRTVAGLGQGQESGKPCDAAGPDVVILGTRQHGSELALYLRVFRSSLCRQPSESAE
jgi:hypothetical protein